MIKGCRHSRQMSCWGRICIRALLYWHTSWSCPGSITGPRLLWNLTSHLCGAGPIAGCSSRTLSAIYPRVGCAPQHRAWCALVHIAPCVCCNAKRGSHRCQRLEPPLRSKVLDCDVCTSLEVAQVQVHCVAYNHVMRTKWTVSVCAAI